MLDVPCPHLGAACVEMDVKKFISPHETTATWNEQCATAPAFEVPTGGSGRPTWSASQCDGTVLFLTAGADKPVTVVCPPVLPNSAGRGSKGFKAQERFCGGLVGALTLRVGTR